MDLPRSYPFLTKLSFAAFAVAAVPAAYLLQRMGQPPLAIAVAEIVQPACIIAGLVANSVGDFVARRQGASDWAGWKIALLLIAVCVYIFPARYAPYLPFDMPLATLKMLTGSVLAVAMLLIVVTNWQLMRAGAPAAS